MKAKSFKKLFVSLALSTILTFSGASSAFAATARCSLLSRVLYSLLMKILNFLLLIPGMLRRPVPLI